MATGTVRVLFGVLLVCMLGACGGGLFEKYYQGPDNLKASSRFYDSSYAVPNGEVPIYNSPDLKADTAKLVAAGFAPLAESSFYGPDSDVSADDLRGLAKKIGAHAVLLQSSYRDTITGAVPLVLPNNSVSYTNATATACGYSGCVNGNGTGVTNTYGTQTVMMPYSKSRSNFDAIFFVKVRPRLGLYVEPLSDVERQELGTNRAARITIVVQGSEAFISDVLPGDYLQSVNGDIIFNQQSLGTALDKYEGQDVKVALLRNGKPVNKTIHVDAITSYTPSTSTTQQVTTANGAPASYATVIVPDTGDEAKELAIANKTCAALGKMAVIDKVRDNGTIAYLCVDK